MDSDASYQDEIKLLEGLDDESDHDQESQRIIKDRYHERRKAMQTWAQKYGCFQLPLKLENTAHSEHEVYMAISDQSRQKNASYSNPKMTIDVIVSPFEESTPEYPQDSTASLEMIRMVNSVPLLDGAESFACGLVKALQTSVLWNLFGLTLPIAIGNETNSWSNHFSIRDSDQVAPFFQSHKHQLWEEKRDRKHADDIVGIGENENTRKRQRNYSILPAKIRLGKILVVVNVDAVPAVLPLPTLSKGRLPINHVPITRALHLALRDCLRNLRATSPGLFLTAGQLRTVERDVRYIPLLASAAAGILGRMTSRPKQQTLLLGVQQMQKEDATRPDHPCTTRSAWNNDEVVEAIASRTILSIRCTESVKMQKKRRLRLSKNSIPKKDEFSDIEQSNDTRQTWVSGKHAGSNDVVAAITLDERSLCEDSSVSTSHSTAAWTHRVESDSKRQSSSLSEGDEDDEWW